MQPPFDMEKDKVSIFQRPLWVTLFALTAAIAWGWAYPLIKHGFSEFGIGLSMTGSKILFAGVRFTISGIILLVIAIAIEYDPSVVSDRIPDQIVQIVFLVL